MAYAGIDDMVERFGQTELIRLTTPDGQEMVAVNAGTIARALEEASALVDTYLRRRYLVPLGVAPREIVRATCAIARYDLSFGESREPGEQVRLAKKEAVDWLAQIAAGTVLLDLEEVQSGDDSYAQVSVRDGLSDNDATCWGRAWP